MTDVKGRKNHTGTSREGQGEIVSATLQLELIRGSYLRVQNFQIFNFGEMVISLN